MRLGRAQERAAGPIAEQLVPVLVQPVVVRLPARPRAVEQAPETPRVVELAQVAQLVNDDVVEHAFRRDDESPREAQVAAGGTGAPERARISDRDAGVL